MNGATPISSQRDLLDAVGRSVRISFRKLFTPVAAVGREQQRLREAGQTPAARTSSRRP